MGIARGDVARDVHLQLRRTEGRGHVGAGVVLRQAQQVGVVVHGLQRGGKQRARLRGLQARPQERRGHQVAHADHGTDGGRALRGAAHVHDGMRVQQFGHAQQLQHFQVEGLQRGVHLLRMLGEVLAQRDRALLQRREQLAGEGLQHGVVGRLLPVQCHPAAPHAVQGLLHGRHGGGGGRAAGLQERFRQQFRAVHAPAALHKVVRFVHQQGHAPLAGLRQAVQQAAHVEVVVVIAHHHVGPAPEFLAQVVGAHPVAQGGIAHAGLVQRCRRPARRRAQRIGPRGRQPVVEAARERAGVAVAGAARVFAGLLARHQFQHAQGRVRGAAGPGATPAVPRRCGRAHPGRPAARRSWPRGRRPCRCPRPARP